jgi:recombinational DNA repair protein RecT
MEQTPKAKFMDVIKNTSPMFVAELDVVREKYIQNYNACHKDKMGELIYHRNVIHFKQSIAASEQLQKCDPFSLYACFATAAVNGYSFDPADDEVYLVPRGGKAFLQRQAGAHVRRLKRTNQIQFADQPRIVYQGDDFEVVNGRVIKHIERYQSENMVAGYVRFELDDRKNDRFFIYRKSDWEAWRKKSPQANGENWNTNGQPVAAFLRTKLLLHACKEKCWAVGMNPANVEKFDVEIEAEDIAQVAAAPEAASFTQDIPHEDLDENAAFAAEPKKETAPGITHDDDDF